jgi:polysaccharide pyruvyl transferase CsaB
MALILMETGILFIRMPVKETASLVVPSIFIRMPMKETHERNRFICRFHHGKMQSGRLAWFLKKRRHGRIAMRVVHLIGGGDEGGAKSHVLALVKALGEHLDVSLVSFRRGPFHDDAVAMGIDAHAIPTRGLWSDVRRTLKIVRRSPCDLLHAHGAKGNLVGLLVRTITGIPMLTTVHSDYRLDYLHSLPKKLTYGLINSLALRGIRHHVSVSENFREMLTARGFDPQHIHSVYNGIPFDNDIPACTRSDFFRRYHVPFPENSLVIGIMARLHPVKDHETFLRAAAAVSAIFPEARFLVGGPGDLLQHLERLAQTLGIRNKVHFAGMVSNPYDFFQIIDINVLTSISESFPYVILEGARFARPTVSSRVGGLGDLIRPGENGFLFEPRDVNALAGHLSELCASPSLRAEMGIRLYESAKSRFSLASMCETQLDIYRRILSDEARTRLDGKRVDIALLGYYGYHNSGDEAILKALTDTMRQARPGITFTVLSRDPRETRSSMKVAAIHRFNVLRTISILLRTRLFVAGGGSLIQDNTSTRSIMYYLGMLSIAKACGARTMLLANGLGPISRPANRRWAHRVLNRLDAITLRDPDSLTEAGSLGITHPETEVTADPAMLLVPASSGDTGALARRIGLPENSPLIGFSIRKWSDSERTIPAIAGLADHCVTAYGATPVFLPMQTPDDVQVSRRIMGLMKQKALLMEEPCPPERLMSLVGRLDMMVGMRLHSLIYAANMGIPMAGLVYEPKVSSFLEEARQPAIGKIGDGNANAWKDGLDAAWSQRIQLAQRLSVRKDILRAAAVRNTDVALRLIDGYPGRPSRNPNT